MDRTARFRLTTIAVLAPLVLGLAACSKDAADGSSGSAAAGPVAAVPPPAGKAWTDVVTVNPEGGYVMGNPQAPVKVLEYGSLSCPHCAAFAEQGYPTLVNSHVASGKVSLEFRSFAIHPQDVPLTMLIQCGGPQTFFPLLEEVYKNFDAVAERTMQGADAAKNIGSLPDNQRFVALGDVLGFTEFFAARGVAKDQAHACLADFNKATALAKQSENYGAQGIESTPTLLVNGNKITGGTWADLNTALQLAGVK